MALNRFRGTRAIYQSTHGLNLMEEELATTSKFADAGILIAEIHTAESRSVLTNNRLWQSGGWVMRISVLTCERLR